MNDHIKHGVDLASYVASVIAVMGWLPNLLGAIAAFFSIMWSLIRIYDRFVKKVIDNGQQ